MLWPGERAGVWLLALGQTLGYACFFYIFAALVLSWEAALGWDKAVLAAGPTLAIVVSASLAPFVGRAVDLGFGRRMMIGGAVLGGLALLLLSQARMPPVYLAAWAGLGAAQALCLYEVCFAFLIRRYGTAARAAITRVTLVAGLASTLAFPAGAWLAATLGWRGAVLVAAFVALGLVAPLHWLGTRGLRPRGTAEVPVRHPAPLHVLRSKAFWVLAGVFSLTNVNHWMLISFLLPVLAERGVASGLAVTAASLIGPAQVLGRLALMRAEGRFGTRPAMWLTVGGMVAAAGLLALAEAGPAFAFAFAATQGAAMGVMTILRPVLVAETLGRQGYGAIAGMMSIPSLIASATAPVLGAVLLKAGGSGLLISVAGALALLALCLAVAVKPAKM